MKVDEVVFTKPGLSARLFAVELGIVDFTRELRDEELAVLLCAGHFDAHGISIADTSAVLRWIGPHLAALRLGDAVGPPVLITFLDYHAVVCSFIKEQFYELGRGPSSLRELTSRPPPSVSTAFSLRGVLHRQREAESRLKTTARISRANLDRAEAPPVAQPVRR